MFEVEPMAKVRVLSAKKDVDSVVQALYDFGAIHVTRSKILNPGQPSIKLEPVSRMLVKTRAVESTLSLKNSPNTLHSNLKGLEKQFDSIPFQEIESTLKEKQELENQLADLRNKAKELENFKNLDLNLKAVKSKTQLLEFALFEANSDNAMQKAREFGQVIALNQKRILVAWDKRKSEKARHAIAPFAKEIPLPEAEESFSHDYSLTQKRISESEKRFSEVKKSIESFASKYGEIIVSLRKALEAEFKKAELPSKFGQSELTGSAEGWITQKSFHDLEKKLHAEIGEGIVVEKIETREMPPSKLQNPAVLRPFEFMIEFFSLPRYKEIDPTFFTAITFPLFFGMILGDIGYGIILLALGAFFALKFKKGFFSSIGGMLVLSSISTIIFGYIYGEFLGAENIFGYHLEPMLSRIHEHGINTLFALSVLIGFLHLTLGLLLGAWQGIREKHLNHTYAKISWLAILFGFTALVANSTHLIFTEYLQFVRVLAPPLDLVALVGGIIGLAYFEGAVQLLEIPSLISNVLSYLRIMALGLSGVALAGIVASIPLDFTKLNTVEGIITFVLLLILIILGHAVAIVLGLIEAGIQSLRLHYVEFYSKFYKGGGTPFVPLRED